MLKKDLTGRIQRGKPKMTFVDVVTEDMPIVDVWEEDADGRVRRGSMICHGDS